MLGKLCKRFIVLFALLFLLAGSAWILPDSQQAANLTPECDACNAKCNDDYNECISMGIERPWKCSQYRMNCFNYCQTEICIY